MSIDLSELSEDDELYVNKALGQFRLQLNGVFAPFNMYGLQLHVPGAIETSIELAWTLHLRLIGIDVPIQSGALSP